MGWISDRHMKQGGSIGDKRRGHAYPKEGHEADSWGGVRARCPACKPR